MIETTKEINLSQLDRELGSRGLNAKKEGAKITISSAHGDISDDELKNAIDKHTALPDPEPTISEKLSAVGLSIDDLKEVLGL